MYFGPKNFSSPQKGLSRSVKRQIATQLVLLALIGGLLTVVVYKLRQEEEVNAPRKAREPMTFRPPDRPPLRGLEEELAGELSGEPSVDTVDSPEAGQVSVSEPLEEVGIVEPQDPEPFVEDPGYLMEAKASDRSKAIWDNAAVHYVHRIRSLGTAEQAPVLSALRGDAVWQSIMDNPDQFRGKLVEIRGNLVSGRRGEPPLELVGLPYPNPSGIDRVYRSYVYDDQGKFFILYTVENQETAHLDGVVVRGYFLQLYTGDVEYQGTLRQGTIPFLVAHKYRLLPSPVATSYDIRPLLPYAIVLTLIMVAVLLYLSHRTATTYEVRRRAARKKAKRS